MNKPNKKELTVGKKTILSYQEYFNRRINKEEWADDFLKILDKTSIADKILFSDVMTLVKFIKDLLAINNLFRKRV